jgi:hypothetical protein
VISGSEVVLKMAEGSRANLGHVGEPGIDVVE